MRPLSIPDELRTEFATVQALWEGKAETRAVDALILTWVKYEKQTRRLFTYLVFQHPNWSQADRDTAQALITDNGGLFPEHCLRGIETLGGLPLPRLLLPHSDHARLWAEVRRIKIYRNKIFHGQLTGHGLSAADLCDDVQRLVEWIAALARAAQDAFGYDGIGRSTCVLAGAPGAPALSRIFATPVEFGDWLKQLTKGVMPSWP